MPASPVYRHLGVWKHGDVTIVRFGQHRILDETAVNTLSEELNRVAGRDDCHKLLLNFSGVDRLTSLMLGKLLMLKRQMEAKGGKLALCEIGLEIRDVFASTRLDMILVIRDTEPEGLEALA